MHRNSERVMVRAPVLEVLVGQQIKPDIARDICFMRTIVVRGPSGRAERASLSDRARGFAYGSQ
jgi:hypothetical protein